jgi:hypothetical protein
LDAFWARAPDTVNQNLREFKNQSSIGQEYGFVAFDPPGPFGRSYDSGMRPAIGILMKSQQAGGHEDKVKFSAARKARSVVHTNMFIASAKGYQLSMFVRTDKKRSIVSWNPTDSEFYTLFTKGLEARIGQCVKRDRAVSIDLVCELQRLSEEE